VGAVAVGRVAIAAAAAGLLLLGTACGERSEPTGATAPLYPVTVVGAGDRTVTAPAPFRRLAVFALGPEEILRELGAGGWIVAAAPESGTIPLPGLRQAKPDLLVAAETTDELGLDRASRATNAPIYVAPGDSIHDVERAVTQLGLLVDAPVAARRVVHRIEATRSLVEQRVAKLPVVTVFVDTGFFTTVSDHSLTGDLLQRARGRNIAGPSPDTGPFDLARLSQLDPDVILLTSDSKTSLADLRSNPRTRRLTAVRTGRVVAIAATLLDPGPRVGEALLDLARLLHPDAFR
jgi:iron complex transport system substrate-binding protein